MILDLPPDAYGVLRDLQSGFTRFDLYFMNDRVIAVKTIGSRAVLLGSVLGGFIGMMLLGARVEAKKRLMAQEAISRGVLDSIADSVMPYTSVRNVRLKKGFFSGSLLFQLVNGGSKKFTFASEAYTQVNGVVSAALGGKLNATGP